MLRYVLPVMLALALVVGCGNNGNGKKDKGTGSVPGTVSAPAAQGGMSTPAAAEASPAANVDAEAVAALKKKYPNQVTIPRSDLKINLPSTWKISSMPQPQGAKPYEQLKDGKRGVTQLTKRLLTQAEKSKSIVDLARDAGNYLLKFKLFDKVPDITGPIHIGGGDAAYFEYTVAVRDPEAPFTIEYLLRKDSNLYMLAFETPGTDKDAYRSLVNEVVQTIEFPAPPAPDPKAEAIKAELKGRIPHMIALVEAGDAEKTMQELMTPDEFDKFKKDPDFKTNLAEFKETFAPKLVEVLKNLNFSDAVVKDGSVAFPTSGRPLVFVKVNGKWCISD